MGHDGSSHCGINGLPERSRRTIQCRYDISFQKGRQLKHNKESGSSNIASMWEPLSNFEAIQNFDANTAASKELTDSSRQRAVVTEGK